MAQTDYKALNIAGVKLYSIDTTGNLTAIPGQIVEGYSATHGWGRFIYLKGVANNEEGFWVTYDEAQVTTALAANAKGPVAVSLTANTTTTSYSWYQIHGKAAAKTTATADNATIGYDSAAGQAGDARAAGDQIYGAIARSAQDTPATGMSWVQLYGVPFVDDFGGA